MKICKDGRIWGQNNKEAGSHLGILGRKKCILKDKSEWNKGKNNPMYGVHRFGKDAPMYGNHLSKETKEKIGKANWKGGKPCCPDCGKIISYGSEYCRNHAYKGNRHYNWKGGITSLETRIRTMPEYYQWRSKVFQKDNYTCSDCGARNGEGKHIELNAHHIKSFRNIFIEFLNEYNQFSPCDDKGVLERLAIKYEPFWDVDNGVTLCEKCHNEKKIFTGNQYIKIGEEKDENDY